MEFDDAQALRETVARHVRHAMEQDPNIDRQWKLAARAGINQSSISRLVGAKTGVTLETLAAVAKACGVMAYKMLLPVSDAPNPLARPRGTAAGQLMERLANAPRQPTATSGTNEAPTAKPRASGLHGHNEKPAPRKKPRTTSHKNQ